MSEERRYMSNWIAACSVGDIDAEDVMRFDDGLVMDHIIECPKHNGRFDYRTGAAKGAPVCVNLKIYEVKLEGGKVLINLG
jgi:3-phenylpropionate/trans-cinnamate dioxygenase ferredoxin subunit